MTVQVFRFWYSSGLEAGGTGRDPQDILVHERKEGRVRNKGSIRNEVKRRPTSFRSTEDRLLLRMCKTSSTIDRRECQEENHEHDRGEWWTRRLVSLLSLEGKRLRSNPKGGNVHPQVAGRSSIIENTAFCEPSPCGVIVAA